MRRPVVTAAALALVASGAPAHAGTCGEGKHCFLHGRYTKNRCWSVRKGSPITSALTTMTPTAAGADGSPGPSATMDGLSFGQDPQVLASPRYLLAYGSGFYTFYDRSTGKPLAASGCVPLSGDFTDLFAPLMLSKDASGAQNANDINLQAPQKPVGCDIDDIDKCKGSCVNEAYDARAFFDRDGSGSGRWWIEVAARNQMWVDDTGGTCPSNGIQPDESRRYLFVAVSKTEDPNDGFHEYALARDYADWPLFSVNNGRLLLGHWDSKKVFVFDSDRLAAGTDTDPFLGQYDEATFSAADRITPVTQYSGGGGASYVLGERGNDLHVYAFKDPTKSPAHAQVTLDHHPDWYMQPLLRSGKLYLAYDAVVDEATKRRAVDVFRVPVYVTGTSPLKITAFKGDSHRLSRDDSSLERPGIEVETSDVVLVWYMRYGLAGDDPAPQARYNVHYPSEGGFDFRDAETLHPGSGKPSGDLQKWADIDLPGGNSDPDAVAFWIAHAYSDASGAHRQVVAQIKPGCASETQCGTECVDLDTDHDNCGSCGHACPATQECRQGTCKTGSCGGANLLTDPRNCGSCGRVCSGTCTQGRCCEPCQCGDGFTADACDYSAACEHVCRGHDRLGRARPRRRR